MAAILAIRDAMANRAGMRKQRVFRDRTMQLDTLSDEELYCRYRLTRDPILHLLDRIRPMIEHPTKRSCALSPETQLLTTLRYLSKGGFLMEVGDLHGIHQSSVSRAFHKTINAINQLFDNISFPLPDDRRPIMCDFYKIAGFPKIIGAIDGTLIPIKRPPIDEEAAYVCRKGFHAINVQAVCDANLRFTNVVSRWQGSSHDSMILQNSNLGEELQQNPPDGWLLGDSGYPCRPWLMTPLLNPQTRAEERYNGSHCKTRNTIERAFGVLKSRFRCLHKSTGCLQFSPVKCTKIILACFKLHNFCLDYKMPEPQPLLEIEEAAQNLWDGHIEDGHAARNRIIERTFMRN